ncbi:MAG: formate dehydrogenase accessory sulfurtransferase FdhD, partial [Candidatus Hydrogenedentes bacterium]|nr:formate dehydrogenase accessory sulfurtransferase FdhD [Candidatus Hydrogenedentota bacterium]
DPCELDRILRPAGEQGQVSLLFQGGQFRSVPGPVVPEARVELNVNGGQLRLAMLCLASDLEAMAVGFLVGEGALRDVDDLDAVEYSPDDGTITVPFSTNPRRQAIILVLGEFSSLAHFQHGADKSRLSAGMFVDRESLLKRKKAKVIIRPSLQLNGTPVTLSVLENASLVITSTDRLGVSTSTVVEDFKLASDRDTVHTFRVPEDLLQLTFTLRAKVQNVSQNKKVDVATSKTFSLNQVDTTEKIEVMHLSRMASSYVLDMLDKTGLPMRGRPIHLTLKHRDFRDQITTTLQTDAKGRIQLGPLSDIVWIKANSEDGSERSWNPGRDAHNYPTYLHGVAGEPLRVPYLGTSTEAIRDELSLLERRGNHYFADRFPSLRIEDGFIVIDNLAPGDYELTLKPWHTQIRIRLSAGAQTAGYVYSNRRHLELSDPSPLHIARVRATEDEIRIELVNQSSHARVHVYATRFMPAYSAYADLGALPFPLPYQRIVPRAESAYISGRNIGDEYRYILDRKYARKFPGNALDRPGMLINPWAIRDTQTGQQAARPGEAPRASRAPEEAIGQRAQSPGSLALASTDFANLDFLSGDSVALLNLAPDEDGVITIDRADLKGRQHLHILALDPGNTAYREISLDDTAIPPLDLRLARGLDPETHSTQQKRITVLEAGDTLVLEDMATSRIEAYDSVESVFRLFATLSKNPTLTEFDFITRWPELPDVEKRELYSKYACHELNYFLYKKDPEFFAETVRPYIRNKMHKTFMDHWLIGADLGHYLSPWEHAQLNIVEKILLAERIPTERVAMARDVADRYNLLPIDIDLFNRLFQTAIQGSALQFRGGVGGALDEKNERFGFEMDDQGAFREESGRFLRGSVAIAPVSESVARQRAAGLAMKMKAPADSISARSEMESLGYISEELAPGRKDFNGFDSRDELRRNRVAQFYQKLDKTKEWAENNYYRLPIEAQNADLITVNAFWRDFATRNTNLPFRSTQIAMASRNFPEMMFALAALDLPFAP